MAYFIGVIDGSKRFAHIDGLRFDSPLKKIFGFVRPPSASTVTRYFGSIRRREGEHLWHSLNTFALRHISSPPKGHTIDLDSTVFVRYGKQEGALKGYNPKKPGRPSHHPLLAFLAEEKMVLHVWLRSGNTHTSSGVIDFTKEALAKFLKPHKIFAIRADSGFFSQSFLAYLESLQLRYVVAAPLTKRIKRFIASEVIQWRDFGKGLSVGETMFQLTGWPVSRRFVLIREKNVDRTNARGKKLFDVPDYLYHVLVTDLDWDPEMIWRFYNDRGDAENRIKELVLDYHAASFCVHKFYGTEAAVRLICFLFNLMTIFKLVVLRNTKPMLNSLRDVLFCRGAMLGFSKGYQILRLSADGEIETRFRKFFENLMSWNPTALQSSGFS